MRRMTYDKVELHNCAEVTEGDGYVALQRVPESVRAGLNPGAQQRVLQPASAEIRFVLEPGETAEVELSSAGHSGAVVFCGDHRHSGLIGIGREPTPIAIALEGRLVECLGALRDRPHAFDPGVVRIMMGGDQVRLHGIKGRVRPPLKEELPSIRYLAYGTSITHGAAALLPHLSYAAQTARHLRADLLNFGVGGSCHAEPAFADYFAGRDDWDIASLALSVNMMDFSAEEFEERVRYMVHTVAGSHPDKPVACITLFTYFGDLGLENGSNTPDKMRLFRDILRKAVADCPTANAHIIEGPDMLRNVGGLTADLIHPAEDGMIEMGRNLANALALLLAADRG